MAVSCCVAFIVLFATAITGQNVIVINGGSRSTVISTVTIGVLNPIKISPEDLKELGSTNATLSSVDFFSTFDEQGQRIFFIDCGTNFLNISETNVPMSLVTYSLNDGNFTRQPTPFYCTTATPAIAALVWTPTAGLIALNDTRIGSLAPLDGVSPLTFTVISENIQPLQFMSPPVYNIATNAVIWTGSTVTYYYEQYVATLFLSNNSFHLDMTYQLNIPLSTWVDPSGHIYYCIIMYIDGSDAQTGAVRQIQLYKSYYDSELLYIDEVLGDSWQQYEKVAVVNSYPWGNYPSYPCIITLAGITSVDRLVTTVTCDANNGNDVAQKIAPLSTTWAVIDLSAKKSLSNQYYVTPFTGNSFVLYDNPSGKPVRDEPM